MNSAVISRPIELVLDKRPETDYGRVEFGTGQRVFQFSNRSPYHVAVRWDWNEASLDVAPDALLKPWNDQIIRVREPVTRMCFMATSIWPGADFTSLEVNQFWFLASDGSSTPDSGSYNATGVQGSINILESTRLVNQNSPYGDSVMRIKTAGDSADRILLTNRGHLLFRDPGVNDLVEDTLQPAAITLDPGNAGGDKGQPSIFVKNEGFLIGRSSLDKPEHGWTNFEPAGVARILSNDPVQHGTSYRKDPNGLVSVKGIVEPFGAASGSAIITLPVGFRPVQTLAFSAATGSNVVGWVVITSAGVLTINWGGATAPVYVSLDAIRFDTK